MEDVGRSQWLHLGRLKECLLLCACLVILPVQIAPCSTTGTKTVCEGKYQKFPDSIPMNVTDLDVSKNRLTSIELNTLIKFVDIRKLNLSANVITYIHSKAFFHLTDIETLDLSFNHLKEINDNILYNNAELKWVSIAHNKNLTFIPQLQSKSLITFNVSTCGIRAMNETTFQEVESIRVLDLSFNELTEIRHHTFDALTLLHELDVSNNKLQNARFINSDCSLSLTYLDISSNNISVLDLSTFQTLLTLRKIHFDNNPWKCNEEMKIVYENMLESEFTLNLKCISPSDNKLVSWHKWYYSINHTETEERIGTCQNNFSTVSTVTCFTNTSNTMCQNTCGTSSCNVLIIVLVSVHGINLVFAIYILWKKLKQRFRRI